VVNAGAQVVPGFSGDGGPASSALLDFAQAIAVDSQGNLYIADTDNERIRKVAWDTGIITTIAGSGPVVTNYNAISSGDGGPATSAVLNTPAGVAVDSNGNVFIGEFGRVRRVDASTGIITTVAGTGTGGSSGDGGPATAAQIIGQQIAVDSTGNLFLADSGRVRKVDAVTGIITTVAGSIGSQASPGNGDLGPATKAQIATGTIALDSSGNLFIGGGGVVREVYADTGIIMTIAGGGSLGGGPPLPNGAQAVNAYLCAFGVAIDPKGNPVGVSGGCPDDGMVFRLTPNGATGPLINSGGIAPAGLGYAPIQPGSWVSIFGVNLATTFATWKGDFPTSLGGTSVTIDGKPAYLSYVSPNQINLQAPDDTNIGNVDVVVSNGLGTTTSPVALAVAAASFLGAPIILTPDGSGMYGGGTYDIMGAPNTAPYATRAAKAGETVVLFGTGFGPTSPTEPAGAPFSGAAPLVNAVMLDLGGAKLPLQILWAGLSGPGLDQFNVVVPSGVSGNNVLVTAYGPLLPSYGVDVFFTIQ
jgi:uncharacterized protein (TIGR03437 family)